MKVVKQLLEMKFSQDMMVYNPFPSLNPVKNSHETGNDKKRMEWQKGMGDFFCLIGDVSLK